MANVINLSILNNMPDGTYKTTVSNLTDGEIIHNDDVTFVGGVSQLPATTSALNDLITGIAVSNERPPLNFAPLLSSVVDDGVIIDQNFLNMWWQDGQSLAVATGAGGIENTETIPNAYLFAGVPATSLGQTPSVPEDLATLIPFQEINNQTNAYSGLTLLNELLGDTGDSWLFANNARGGADIELLSPPDSDIYENGIKMTVALPERANDLELNPHIPFMTWVQGESDAGDEVYHYLLKLRTLHDLKKSAATSATGQNSLPILVEQIAALDAQHISKGFFAYSEDNEDAFLTMPKYMLNRLYYSTDSDRVHLNFNGYIIMGEYQAIAAHKLLTTGDSKCLQPISVTVNGNIIRVKMNVPTMPMVIDTTILPECPNYGISFRNSDGLTVDSNQLTVTIDGDEIVVDTGSPVYAGSRLEVGGTLNDPDDNNGSTLACTNVRDSNPRSSSVNGYTLNNWMVQFDWIITDEDAPTTTPTELIGDESNLWTAGQSITATGLEGAGTISGDTASDFSELTEGTYHITCTHNGDKGGFRFRLGNGSAYFTGVGSPKRETVTISVTGDITRFRLYGSTGFEGSISNIIVIKES